MLSTELLCDILSFRLVVTLLLLLATASILTSFRVCNFSPSQTTRASTPLRVATLRESCFLHFSVWLRMVDRLVIVVRPCITSVGTAGLLYPSAPIDLRCPSASCLMNPRGVWCDQFASASRPSARCLATCTVRVVHVRYVLPPLCCRGEPSYHGGSFMCFNDHWRDSRA
eukprot:scaffold113_cov214-Prasinococcus_capsulatus_cf.AAC.1